MAKAKQNTVLPVLQGLLPLERGQAAADILAGVTLAALALPEVLGYTRIAGTPVITGLYTMLAPMLLYAVFGASRHLVVGADSATAAILAASLGGMALPGYAGPLAPASAEWMAMAQLLALMAAGFLLAARVLRLGFLADFLSRTVLVGFLTGVGIQVALGQVSYMLGLEGVSGGTVKKAVYIASHAAQANLPSCAVAAAALAVILGAKRLSRKAPGALIAVVCAIAASRFLHLEALGVKLIGAVPRGLPQPGLPDIPWSWNLLEDLTPTAFAMFVVILAQSAATSRAFAAKENERFDENADLVGLALANIGAALTGAFVVNGSPTKTQMVESAGGRSQLAQLSACAVVLCVLLFLTGPLAFLPEAALAAIIFMIGVELVDLRGICRIYAVRRSEFWIALVTALVVVFIGVGQSIILAIVLSLLDHTRQGYLPHNAVLGRDEAHGFSALPVGEKAGKGAILQIEPGLMVYRFSHSIYYANADLLMRQVTDLARAASPPLKWFCIDAAAIDDVDYTGAVTLRALHEMLTGMGIRLVVAQFAPEVRGTLEKYELTGLIGKDAFFDTIGNVLHAYGRLQSAHGKKK